MKKTVAFILITALVLSLVPISAFAVEVESISFKPANENQYVFYENADGYIFNEGMPDEHYVYNLNFHSGDILTVNYTGDTSKDFVFNDYDGTRFVAEDGSVIQNYEFFIDYNQYEYEKRWLVNGSYEFYVEYAGKRATVNASVIPNPVKRIEYQPFEPKTVYFETNGEWRYEEDGITKYYYYNVFSNSSGDILRVFDNDDVPTEYICDFDEGDCVYRSASGDRITRFQIDMRDNQWERHYTVGSDNYYYVTYKGRTANVPVTIVNSPVSKIVFTPSKNPVVFYENAGGDWDHDEFGEPYFRYYGYSFCEGDILSVEYAESGETAVYTYLDYYNQADGIYYQGFYDNSKERLDESDLHTYYEGRWQKGADNVFYVYYKGRVSDPVSVQIVDNPVAKIRFEKVKDVVYVEGDTHYDMWDDRYYYDSPNFENGDRLIIINAQEQETVYTYNMMTSSFVCDGNEDISSRDVRIYSNQRENPWVKDGNNEYYVEYRGQRATLNAYIIENPVKAIEYIPVGGNLVLTEGVGCREDMENGVPYNRYDYRQYEMGDVLVIIDNDNVRTNYTLTFGENYNLVYKSTNGDIIETRDVNIYDEQNINHWDIGSDNEYYVEYSGRKFTLYATINENLVKEIEYKPIKDVSIVDGSTTGTDYYNGEPYVHYDYTRHQPGDVLTVTYKDDSKKVFTLIEDEETFDRYYKSDLGEIINEEDVIIDDEQFLVHWGVGTNNEYFAEYSGKRYTLYAEITVNPVKEIEFIPKEQPYVVEGVNCDYNPYMDYTYYYEPEFEEGDKLIVTYTDDSSKTFIGVINEFGDVEFVSQTDDEVIPFDDIWTVSDQWQNHWSDGGENKYAVRYMGREFTLNCEIRSNPVDAIKYEPANITTYFEGTHMEYDPMADMSFYEMPRIENGDKLTVTYTDAQKGTVVYTAEYDFESDSVVFKSESGEIITTFRNRWLRLENSQYMMPWEVGENFYTVEYYGKTYDVPVIIKKNNIVEIEMIFNNMPEVYAVYFHTAETEDGHEFKEYDLPWFNDGDILRLVDDNNIPTDYVFQFCEEDGEHYFTHESEKIHPYELNCYSNQYENEWKLGTGNYFTVELFGLTTDVEVKLIETDVEEITYVKANPIILDENTNGELRRDDFGNTFYFYNAPIAEVGDKIIVKYTGNDTPVEYTVQFDAENNVGYAISADGDRIEDGDANIDDRQFDIHWTAGDNNYFYVVYHGVETKVKVVINHTASDEWQSDENSHWHPCTACREKIDEQAHTAGEWIIDVEPSISTDGSMHKECTVCHQVLETKIIPDTHIAGDINGDGVVNNKDLVRLFKYLTDSSVAVNERALDVNGDKTVNNADLLRLLKYLTRWNVEVY